MGTYRRLAVNTAATLGGRAASIVIALLLSTVLFNTLGAARYGVWSFCYVLVGYLTLFDLGLGVTVERLVARHYWASEPTRVPPVLNFAITCAAVFAALLQGGVLVAPLGWLDSPDARQAARVLPVCLLLSLLSTIAAAGLSGLQQMGQLNLVRTVANTTSGVAIMVAALSGVTRLDLLLLIHGGGLALAAGSSWQLLRRRVPGLRFVPLYADRSLAREFARFAGAMQVATFAPQVADQAFRVLLGVRFGAPFMGYYDLGSRAALAIRSAVSALFVAMVPFATQQDVAGGTAALARLSRLALKYTALALVPLSALAMYQSRALIELWLGASTGSEAVLSVFRVCLVVHVVAGLCAPIMMIARSVGVAAPEALWQSLAGSTGVVVALVAPGPVAAVAAFSGLSALGVLVLAVRLRRRLSLRISVARDLLAVSGVTLVGVSVAAGAEAIAVLWAGNLAALGLGVRVLAAGLLALPVMAILSWKSGLLTREEREFWKSLRPSNRLSSRAEPGPAFLRQYEGQARRSGAGPDTGARAEGSATRCSQPSR